MTAAEKKARANPVCQWYRAISLEISHNIRRKLKPNCHCKRRRDNPYPITLTWNRRKYHIWWMWHDHHGTINLDWQGNGPQATLVVDLADPQSSKNALQELLTKLRQLGPTV